MYFALLYTDIITESAAKSNFIMEISCSGVVELINYEGDHRKTFKGYIGY